MICEALLLTFFSQVSPLTAISFVSSLSIKSYTPSCLTRASTLHNFSSFFSQTILFIYTFQNLTATTRQAVRERGSGRTRDIETVSAIMQVTAGGVVRVESRRTPALVEATLNSVPMLTTVSITRAKVRRVYSLKI